MFLQFEQASKAGGLSLLYSGSTPAGTGISKMASLISYHVQEWAWPGLCLYLHMFMFFQIKYSYLL